MKSTRADVAKLAGVSSATVSNALNHSQKVKKETADRIFEAVNQLNYRPDMIARSMTTRKTMQLGILLENIRNPHYGEIVEHFEEAAEAAGYFVNICTGISKLDNYFDNFISRGLDGAFVAVLPYKFQIKKLYELVDHGIKVVVSGNINADFRRVSSIENDYIKAMDTAVSHLVSYGHEDIAYLSGLGKELPYDERCKGYVGCIERFGLPCGDSLLINGNYPYNTNARAGYDQAKRLIASGKRFTAVICGNDLMAIGAIKAFEEASLNVPRDVSVIGFDGIEIGRYCNAPLTTMNVDNQRFGSKAFELLYNNIVNETTGFYRNELTFSEGNTTRNIRLS